MALCRGNNGTCERETDHPSEFCSKHRPTTSKLYYKATGPDSFVWVDSPEKATQEYKEAAEVTQKRFKGAQLEEVLNLKSPHPTPVWVVGMKN